MKIDVFKGVDDFFRKGENAYNQCYPYFPKMIYLKLDKLWDFLMKVPAINLYLLH